MSANSNSVFVRHEACPECKKRGEDFKGDNLARYSDGHAVCMKCGYYEKGEGNVSKPKPDVQGDVSDVDDTKDQKNRPFKFKDTANFTDIRARGISAATCEKYGYFVSTHFGKHCHVASYENQRGELAAQHIRMPQKRFAWIGKLDGLMLYGQRLFRGGGKRVVVTEGELDCLSIAEVYNCKWPIVSIPSGVNSAARAFRDNMEWLDSYQTVVICFDMDEPGQKAARRCALLLPPGKAVIVSGMSEKDASDMLVNGKVEELKTALWEAKPFRPDGIRDGKDMWDDVIAAPRYGWEIPYKKLSQMLRGIMPGCLYLFTAGSGIGKSTLVNEIAYHLKMSHKLPLGVFALEESPARNLKRYMGIYLDLPLHLPEGFAYAQKAELEKAFHAITDNGWYIYEHFGSMDIDTLLSKFRFMAIGLNCRILVLDHISIVVSGLEDRGDNERKTIDLLMTRLRSLIEETGITVLAIVHLKRPDTGKSYNEGRQVSLTDLRGSGSLEQLSDAVISMERDQQTDDLTKQNINTLRVLKNRLTGETGLAGLARYDPPTGRLLDYDPAGIDVSQNNSFETRFGTSRTSKQNNDIDDVPF